MFGLIGEEQAGGKAVEPEAAFDDEGAPGVERQFDALHQHENTQQERHAGGERVHFKQAPGAVEQVEPAAERPEQQ